MVTRILLAALLAFPLMAQSGRTYPTSAFSVPTTPPACTTPAGYHASESFGDGPAQVNNYYTYCGIGSETGCTAQWAFTGTASGAAIVASPGSPPANTACGKSLQIATGTTFQAVRPRGSATTGNSDPITSGSTSGTTVTIGMADTTGFAVGGTIALSTSGIDPAGMNGLYGVITTVTPNTSVVFTATTNPGSLTWVSGGTAYAGTIADFWIDITSQTTSGGHTIYGNGTTLGGGQACGVNSLADASGIRFRGFGQTYSSFLPVSGGCAGGARLCLNTWYHVVLFCGLLGVAGDSWISIDGGTTKYTFQSNTVNKTPANDWFGTGTTAANSTMIIGSWWY